MTEQAPCFQPGFDLLNVENSDDFLREKWLVALINFGLHQLKVALISESHENEVFQNALLCITLLLFSL